MLYIYANNFKIQSYLIKRKCFTFIKPPQHPFDCIQVNKFIHKKKTHQKSQSDFSIGPSFLHIHNGFTIYHMHLYGLINNNCRLSNDVYLNFGFTGARRIAAGAFDDWASARPKASSRPDLWRIRPNLTRFHQTHSMKW